MWRRSELLLTQVRWEIFINKRLDQVSTAVYVPKTAIPLKEAFGSSYVQGRVVSLDTEGRRVRLESCTVLYCTVLYCTVGEAGERGGDPVLALCHRGGQHRPRTRQVRRFWLA